ncbi:hypothetical protein HMPREF9413_5871 [Paenibacillus sp. HGF7]|nr:hypothetical protein HMPREF9413_5871 [Paenibacillus sp. HGF7]
MILTIVYPSGLKFVRPAEELELSVFDLAVRTGRQDFFVVLDELSCIITKIYNN